MSTKNTYFGVPSDILFEEAVRAAASIPSALDTMPSAMVLLSTLPDDTRPLRWFTFASTHPRRIVRGTFVESLEYKLPTLVTVCHDDQNGVYLYRRRQDGKSTMLLSDGDQIGVVAGKFDLSGVTGDAVAVGLRAHFPGEPPRAYLDVEEGPAFRFRLHPDWRCDWAEISAGEVRKLRLKAMVDFLPEDWDWQRAKIPRRTY